MPCVLSFSNAEAALSVEIPVVCTRAERTVDCQMCSHLNFPVRHGCEYLPHGDSKTATNGLLGVFLAAALSLLLLRTCPVGLGLLQFQRCRSKCASGHFWYTSAGSSWCMWIIPNFAHVPCYRIFHSDFVRSACPPCVSS